VKHKESPNILQDDAFSAPEFKQNILETEKLVAIRYEGKDRKKQPISRSIIGDPY
jgi:hypothetical protein